MSLRRAQHRGGFTLVELMVTVTILSIVVYMTMESLTRQQKTSIVTEKVVEAQQNMRAVASLLEREIRMAGFMVPDSVGICGIDSTTGPDDLFVSDIAGIVPDDERAADLGSRITSGVPVSPNNPSITVGSALTLTVDSTDLDGDGSFFYDNDGNGTPESDFEVGAGFILADAANPGRGTVCGVVVSTNGTQVSGRVLAGGLDTHVPLNDAPEDLVVVPAIHYAIDNSGGDFRFERNGDLLTSGVEDVQYSYFFDDDDDGVAAASEQPGVNQTDYPGAPLYDPAATDNSNLKEVRFSIVVRTRDDDPEFNDGAFLAFENRTDPGNPNDGYRRRPLIATVRPRNIAAPGEI